MTERLNYAALAPEAAHALYAFSVASAPHLDERLRELIDLRLSQINGCAFCLDMHSAALTKLGADPRQLHVLAAWREATNLFSAAERAAFAWVEAVNALPHRQPTDQDFEDVRAHFEDEQIVEMTFAVGAIRAWNMLNASFHRGVPETPFVVAK
jgi:AhpD family alkylhydroperoxidase